MRARAAPTRHIVAGSGAVEACNSLPMLVDMLNGAVPAGTSNVAEREKPVESNVHERSSMLNEYRLKIEARTAASSRPSNELLVSNGNKPPLNLCADAPRFRCFR